MILGFLKNILGTTCYHQYQVTPINDFKLWWYEELLIDYSDKTFTSNRWLLPTAEYDIKIFKTDYKCITFYAFYATIFGCHF